MKWIKKWYEIKCCICGEKLLISKLFYKKLKDVLDNFACYTCIMEGKYDKKT